MGNPDIQNSDEDEAVVPAAEGPTISLPTEVTRPIEIRLVDAMEFDEGLG